MLVRSVALILSTTEDIKNSILFIFATSELRFSSVLLRVLFLYSPSILNSSTNLKEYTTFWLAVQTLE